MQANKIYLLFIIAFTVKLQRHEHLRLINHGAFDSLKNSASGSRKQIIKDILDRFYHENVCSVYTLESPHWCDSKRYTQHTNIL